MGCCNSKISKHTPGYEEPTILAAETPFSVSEVEALYELFKKISSSIINDGLIHKEEFQLALFRNKNRRNLFADRLFDLFDFKRNGVIEFGEFVRSLGVFHPNAPVADKIEFAFRLYDLRQTGYIEREELKEMVLALLHESDLVLSDDVVEMIVDKSFTDADSKGDGRIDQEEWKEFVAKNPALLKNMTLPYLKFVLVGGLMPIRVLSLASIFRCKGTKTLKTLSLLYHGRGYIGRTTDITLAFPSFLVSSEVDDSELCMSD